MRMMVRGRKDTWTRRGRDLWDLHFKRAKLERRQAAGTGNYEAEHVGRVIQDHMMPDACLTNRTSLPSHMTQCQRLIQGSRDVGLQGSEEAGLHEFGEAGLQG